MDLDKVFEMTENGIKLLKNSKEEEQVVLYQYLVSVRSYLMELRGLREASKDDGKEQEKKEKPTENNDEK